MRGFFAYLGIFVTALAGAHTGTFWGAAVGLMLAGVCFFQMPPAQFSPGFRCLTAVVLLLASMAIALVTGLSTATLGLLAAAAYALAFVVICWAIDVVDDALAPFPPDAPSTA